MQKSKCKLSSQKRNLSSSKGITLIALVVTIVVLLILAGVSINIIFSDNGLIQRARNLQNTVNEAQLREMSEIDKLLYEMERITDSQDITKLQTAETKPYLPSSEYYVPNKIDGNENNLANGLVMKDKSGNEYVWIKVPTSIYTNEDYNGNGTNEPEDKEDYEKIRACLQEYSNDYGAANYEDYWYYREGSESPYTTYFKDPLGEEAEHQITGTSNTKTDLEKGTINNLTIKTGCGLTYAEYQEYYKAMLKSIYINGGFYIGRYEAGMDEISGYSDTTNFIPYSQKNKYPINWVTCADAQQVASKVVSSTSKYHSSLLFGIQWDLVIKYLETFDWSSEKVNSI